MSYTVENQSAKLLLDRWSSKIKKITGPLQSLLDHFMYINFIEKITGLVYQSVLFIVLLFVSKCVIICI